MERVTDLVTRIDAVRENIADSAARSGRAPSDVTLVAVSKTASAELVTAVAGLGVREFGENRVQEAEAKIPKVASALAAIDRASPRWHLVGHLQTNKARSALRLFSVIESVDRVSLAVVLDRLARESSQLLDVLLEVNVGLETSKFGFAPASLPGAFEQLRELKSLRIRGLMTVAPMVMHADEARPFFRLLRELRDRLVQANPGVSMPELSMGMTGDYPVAVEEGATIVRVGRAIFGERGKVAPP